jgi:hypothetical protein
MLQWRTERETCRVRPLHERERDAEGEGCSRGWAEVLEALGKRVKVFIFKFRFKLKTNSFFVFRGSRGQHLSLRLLAYPSKH